MPRCLLAIAMLLALALSAAGTPVKEDAAVALKPDRLEARIRECRTAEVALTVTDSRGRPLKDAAVTVRQTRHKFLFGCNIFDLKPQDASPLQKAYQERFAALLNYATLPFYWKRYEPERGKPDEARVRAMAEWCRDHGITTKGHPLCWHETMPEWTLGMPLEEAERLQMDRIRRDMTAFKGLIGLWDVVNEAVVTPDFRRTENQLSALCRQVGRAELVRRAFAAARQAGPDATLVLNDYDHSERYEQLIEECLKAGVPIHVIGLQSHMHRGYLGSKRIWAVCERFARFGLPLHWTEASLISGDVKPDMQFHGRYEGWETTPAGEKRQADDVADFYTTLFSHPAVEAVTWWDFPDGRWLGAPSGLVRKDMSAKPAYERLLGLVKGAWWTGEVSLRTDAAGRATFRGFLGDYAVESGGLKGALRLDAAGPCQATVRLGR
jgi:GH35 family endo-1,4-beta-xylanase